MFARSVGRACRKGREIEKLTSKAMSSLPRVAVIHQADSPVLEKFPFHAVKDQVDEFVLVSSQDQMRQANQGGKKVDALLVVPPADANKILDPVWNELDLGSKIRWMHCMFAGVDSMRGLMQNRLSNPDIPLTNGRGAFSGSLAEYVLMAMLHFNKQVPRILSNRVEKKWDRFEMSTIGGKTVGFVGFGDIAQTSARLARACGMNIAAYRRNSAKNDKALVQEFDLQSFDDVDALLRASDFVVCTLPGTDLTKHFFNQERFASMKDGAVFISCGRGICVDENALFQAVSAGKIFAALDVFEVEPLPEDSPLWTLPGDRFLLTAHNADLIGDYFLDGWNVFVKNLHCYNSGSPLATLVDKTAGY